jgi:hypothetical protein
MRTASAASGYLCPIEMQRNRPSWVCLLRQTMYQEDHAISPGDWRGRCRRA